MIISVNCSKGFFSFFAFFIYVKGDIENLEASYVCGCSKKQKERKEGKNVEEKKTEREREEI